MSLLVIDETRSKVGRISTDEWRVVRLLRLLDSGENQEVFGALCRKVAAVLTANDRHATDQDAENDDYLVEMANRAIPSGDDILGLLIDHGSIDDLRGSEALEVMTRSSDTIDEVAGGLFGAYSMLVDENPAFYRIPALYKDLEPEEAEAAFHDAMMGVVHEWRERFIERLEQAVAQFRQQQGVTPAL